VCHALTEIATLPFTPETVELTRICGTETVVEDLAIAKPLIKLIGLIEDHDDVNKVYHNADIPESVWNACAV
jgi:transcriptional/translational regulatory protein YebC/TACO1